MNLEIGLVIGAIVILALLAIIAATLRDDAPAEPPAAIDNRGARERLFQLPQWQKQQLGGTQAAAPPYNRPLDVQPLPDDGLLPPPREIQGVNGGE